jgi:hypothetical protein
MDNSVKLEAMFGTTTQHVVVLIDQVKPEYRWHAALMSEIIDRYAELDAHKSVYVVPGRWRKHLDPVIFTRHNVSVAHDGSGPGNPVLGRSSSSTSVMIYLDLWPYLKTSQRFNSSCSDPSTAIFNQIAAPNAKKIVFVVGNDHYEKLRATCNVALKAVRMKNFDVTGGLEFIVDKDNRRELENFSFFANNGLQPYSVRHEQLVNALKSFCDAVDSDELSILCGGGALMAANRQAKMVLRGRCDE